MIHYYYSRCFVYIHCVSEKVTTFVVNNFYKVELILIIFDALYAETTGF